MFNNRNNNRGFPPKVNWSKKAFVKCFTQTLRHTVLKPESLGCRNFPISVGNLSDIKKQIQLDGQVSLLIFRPQSSPWGTGNNCLCLANPYKARNVALHTRIPPVFTKPQTYSSQNACRYCKRSGRWRKRVILHLRKSRKNVNGNYSRSLIRGKYTPKLLGKTQIHSLCPHDRDFPLPSSKSHSLKCKLQGEVFHQVQKKRTNLKIGLMQKS